MEGWWTECREVMRGGGGEHCCEVSGNTPWLPLTFLKHILCSLSLGPLHMLFFCWHSFIHSVNIFESFLCVNHFDMCWWKKIGYYLQVVGLRERQKIFM